MASSDDNFIKVGEGTATTLASPGYTIGATSVTVVSTTNWSTDTGVIFAIDTAEIVNGEQEQVAGTYCEFEGVVTGATTIASVALVSGTPQNYTAGALTRVYIPVSSEVQNRMVNGELAHADQDGTLKAGAVDVASVLASDVVETAKIKDLNVTTGKLADSAVTDTKVDFTTLFSGAAVSYVATSQTTTSTSYVGLTTAQTVTATVRASGKLIVGISVADAANSAANNQSRASFALSGANTVASGTNGRVIMMQAYTNNAASGMAGTFLLTGLTPGSTTVTMQFAVGGGTGTFAGRNLWVLPI